MLRALRNSISFMHTTIKSVNAVNFNCVIVGLTAIKIFASFLLLFFSTCPVRLYKNGTNTSMRLTYYCIHCILLNNSWNNQENHCILYYTSDVVLQLLKYSKMFTLYIHTSIISIDQSHLFVYKTLQKKNVL